MTPPRVLFPPEKFPFTIEFLHPLTRAVVHVVIVEISDDGTLAQVYIPPVAKMVGHAVDVRVTFADGEVSES